MSRERAHGVHRSHPSSYPHQRPNSGDIPHVKTSRVVGSLCRRRIHQAATIRPARLEVEGTVAPSMSALASRAAPTTGNPGLRSPAPSPENGHRRDRLGPKNARGYSARAKALMQSGKSRIA